MKPRRWHIYLYAIAGAGFFSLADLYYMKVSGHLPRLTEIWWVALIVPVLCGSLVTLGAGGATLGRRVLGGAICGIGVGIFYTAASTLLGWSGSIGVGEVVSDLIWRVFLFTILTVISLLFTEIMLPDPTAHVSEK